MSLHGMQRDSFFFTFAIAHSMPFTIIVIVSWCKLYTVLETRAECEDHSSST
jgi:hypothetical protein